MFRIVFTLLLFSVLFLSGCYSPRVADAYNFNVTRAELNAAGDLEIEGNYLEKAWGITELRGKVSQDAILLSGVIEHGKSNVIRHCIARIPAYINQVKIGSKVIWDRHRKNVLPVPAVPAVKKIAVLKIGRRNMDFSKVDFPGFIEIFWGRDPEKNADVQSVRYLDFFDVKTVNGLTDLSVLEIAGTENLRSVDLSGLDLPELKKLVLYNVEVSGLEKAQIPKLQEFRIDDFRSVPLGKVVLPENLPELRKVSIQSFAGNFDFNSLEGKPIEKLQIHGDCSRFSFLKRMPLKELKLSGFRVVPGELEILKTLPLEKLKLASRRITQWGFLKGMKLKLLDIEVAGANDFSPALLEGMPLEVLRLYTNSRDFGEAWQHCRDLPLKELILRGSVVPEKFIRQSRIENLALIGNFWRSSDPQETFISMSDLKHLAVWNGIILRNNRPYSKMVDKWDRLSSKKLESIRLMAKDLSFAKKLPSLTRIALQNKAVISPAPLANRSFDCLLFNFDERELMRHRIVKHSPRRKLPPLDY